MYSSETKSAAVESKGKLVKMSWAIERLEKKTKRPVLEGKMKEAAEDKFFSLIDEVKPSVEEIENLINVGVNINCRNEKGYTALLQLMCTNCISPKQNVIEIVRLFVVNGIDVNATDENQSNVLHWLCCCSQESNLIDIVRLLLENGVDVNANSMGMNPLHYVTTYYKKSNLIDIVRLLLENGVDTHAKNNEGKNVRDTLHSYFKGDNVNDILSLMGYENV